MRRGESGKRKHHSYGILRRKHLPVGFATKFQGRVERNWGSAARQARRMRQVPRSQPARQLRREYDQRLGYIPTSEFISSAFFGGKFDHILPILFEKHHLRCGFPGL